MVESVHYYSLLDCSGYGDAAAAYIDGLLRHGVRVRWTPLVVVQPSGLWPLDRLPPEARPPIEIEDSRRRELFRLIDDEFVPEVVICHGMPEVYRRIDAGSARKIGFTVWETTDLPPHWPPLLSHVDRLLVPCEFNVPLFTLPGGPPVSRVPHIADNRLRSIDAEAASAFRRRLGVGPETLVFYNISSWSPRKAIWDTLHAYLLAFSAGDDVCMVLKTDVEGQDFSRPRDQQYHPTKDLVAQITSAYPDPARIAVVDDQLSVEQMRALHGAGDCYFSLAHSEGWGIGAFEAAAAGNPVIITGWGGQCDYLDPALAWLVDYRMAPIVQRPHWESYAPGQRWAQADVEHAIDCLQAVFQDRAAAAEKGGRLQASVFSRFDSDTVTADLIAAIDDGDS